MSARRGIACAGCWTLDRLSLIEAWPAEEELVRILDTDRHGGGSAHNVSVGLRRLAPDLPVEVYGLLGADEDGDFLLDVAASHGIDTSRMRRTDEAVTAYTEVMTVQGSGRRTFFYRPGTNDLVTPDMLDVAAGNARFLHLGLVGVHAQLDTDDGAGGNGWSSVLRDARSAGLRTNIELVSIDPQRTRRLLAPCLPHLDLLIVNDHEIGALAGEPTLREGRAVPEICEKAAWKVLQQGAMDLVAVHYPAGAILLTRDGRVYRRPSLDLAPGKIRGSVGAGDAFAAGLLYALHEDWAVEEGLRLAHAVAAASLRDIGAVGGIVGVEQCLALAAG